MKIALLTSGGDSPGMNAAIRAVVRSSISYGHRCFCVYDGYKGLVEGNIKEFFYEDVSEILNRGGTILGTARLPEFLDENVRQIAINNLKKLEIDALIVIGGDGTYRGALDLTKMGFKCIGIPGTIDNDINSTKYTIGFSTALNTACEAIDKLRDTSSSHQRCSIIEVMGRYCPDLALYSGLCCGAEYIVASKDNFKLDKLLEDLKVHKIRGRKHAIVVISEHICDVYELARKIEDYTKYECRATVLGYVQRGGSPTPEDRLLATRLATYAVDLASKNIFNCVVGIKGDKLIHTDFNTALNMKPKANKELFDLFKKLQRK